MNWANVVWATTWPPLFAVLWPFAARRRFRDEVGRAWVSGGLGAVISESINADWPALGIALVQVLIGVWLIRRNRRRRDRAPKAYGAKSKALLAALVRRAREAARPRQVLSPVPEGS